MGDLVLRHRQALAGVDEALKNCVPMSMIREAGGSVND
jgi:hypothetical protein